TIAVTTDWPEVTYMPQWLRAWLFSDTTNHFWDQFSTTGRLDPNSTSGEPGEPVAGTLGLIVKLAPGQSAELPLLISWCYPTMPNNWGKPFYSTLWPDAFSAAEFFFKNRKMLTERTVAFEKAFYSSTLPDVVLDAAGANASTLHTPTCLRMEDGTLWGWEGCSPREGCCGGSCTHVWNYSLTPAYLFPSLHRTMRMSEYKYGFGNDEEGRKGSISFRIPLPLGSEAHSGTAASDGQLGGIIQLYRDWRLCGSKKYLEDMWPGAKRALEFAWAQWDTNKDGLIEGDQHNTYDINFQGPNPLTQMMYLGALQAGSRMAEYLGDTASAAEYRRLFKSGQAKTDTLYNGEYLYQTTDCLADNAPKYQHGKGCLSDQVFGQLCAHVAGLGYLYDEARIKSAIQAVYKYNFRSPLGDYANTQRIYALYDESGLLLCSWPNGGRPKCPFIYSDEVWTGIEYQVASHLIYEGFYTEGLNIVRAARQRHDGVRRNPFNEYECGSHYARAMSSWGLVGAISGFRYDAVEKTVYLTPRGDHKDAMKCFFSTDSAWGTFEYQSGKLTIAPIEGELTIEKLVTPAGSFDVPTDSQKVSPNTILRWGPQP
ncbi:MAG: GH116 family glycosyl hydrolase, partial [Anaerohalosphaeraceae bacterium]